MNEHADKMSKNKTGKHTNPISKANSKSESTFQLIDNRSKNVGKKTHASTINQDESPIQLKHIEEKNNSELTTQLKVIQLSKWDKADPDAKLSRQDQVAYAAHIGLTHSYTSHESNYVPSVKDLDASRHQQFQISAAQTQARLAKEASRKKNKM